MSRRDMSPYLEKYLQSARLLSLEEEEMAGSIIVKYRDRTDLTSQEETEYRKARDSLVEGNIKFIAKVAYGYYERNKGHCSLDDLVSEGILGLFHAMNIFQLDRNTKFLSYAVYWIRQKMRCYIMDHSRNIRIPQNVIICLKRIKDVQNSLGEERNNVFLISERTKIGEENILFYLSLINNELSLSTPISRNESDSKTLVDFVVANDSRIRWENYSRDDILRGINSLKVPLRNKKIVIMYLGLDGENGETPLSLEEVGRRHGLTRERIRQIRNKIIPKLRRCLLREEY